MASSKSSISARGSRMFSPLASQRSMRWAKARRGAIPTRLAIARGAARNAPDTAAPNCLMSSSAVKNRSAFQNFAIISSAKSSCDDRPTAQYSAPCAEWSCGRATPRSLRCRARQAVPAKAELSAQILADEILHRRERVLGTRRALAALGLFLLCRFLLCRFLWRRDLAILLFRCLVRDHHRPVRLVTGLFVAGDGDADAVGAGLQQVRIVAR